MPNNAFTKAGYRFIGWAQEQYATAPTYSNGASVRNLANTQDAVVVLYAIYEEDTYNLSINVTGGKGIVYVLQEGKVVQSVALNSSTTITLVANRDYTLLFSVGYMSGISIEQPEYVLDNNSVNVNINENTTINLTISKPNTNNSIII